MDCTNQEENKEKELIFNYSKSSLTLEIICSLLKKNFDCLENCRQINLFNDKGILITEDADLFYLQEKKILFFTKNNEKFNTFNLERMFIFIKKLGAGGFGEVYLVKEKMTNTKYAIKFLRHNLSNVKDVNFLYKEIEVLMRLEHPKIIKLYSYFTTKKNNIALIMEYIGGGTLRQYIKQHQNRRLEEYETRNIIYQILKIISYCHKMNIIHHDLKPENILFTDNSHTKIKIIDFGISTLINSQSKAGSLVYLPPEIINENDTRSMPSVDIWSIGCIFGEMLIGKILFKGKNSKETKKLILLGKFNVPNYIYISDDAMDLLKKMLEKDPKKRITVDEALQHNFFSNCDISFEKVDEINDSYFNKYSLTGSRKNNKNNTVKIVDVNFSNIISPTESRKRFIRNNVNKKKTLKININNKKLDYKYDLYPIKNLKAAINDTYFGVDEIYNNRQNINKNTKNNILKNTLATSTMYTKISKSLLTEVNSKSKEHNSKQNRVIFNFSSRENMARNKLMINLRKVENYKKDLENVKFTRDCYGTNIGYAVPSNNRTLTPYKPTKSLVTKVTKDISEDELMVYCVNMAIKYKGNVPNFMKPIGLSKEQKKRIDRLTKGIGKCHKNGFNRSININTNENQKQMNNVNLIKEPKLNSYSKLKKNKCVLKSPIRSNKVNKTSEKFFLPKIK